MKRLLWVITLAVVATTTQAGTLLNSGNFTYLGAFRVPQGNQGGDSTEWTMGSGGNGVTFNPSRGTLIMLTTSSERHMIEISIPNPVNSTNINDLNIANTIQAPKNITNSTWDYLNTDGSLIANGGAAGTLLVYNNQLIGSVYPYYANGEDGDGNPTAPYSFFKANLNWIADGTGFSGFKRVGVNPESSNSSSAGWVGSYKALIPAEWQSQLGFPVLIGNGAIPVITRSSRGPSIFGFDPATIGVQDPAPATIFAGYPSTHQTLGTYEVGSLYYNNSTGLQGMIFPAGSNSVLIYGYHGLTLNGQGTDSCYGYGTTDIELHHTPHPESEEWCYDPTDSSKGGHGFPYVSQVWAYDANDFLAVKNGTKQYWEVTPYARWTLSLPFTEETSSQTGKKMLGGAAYDPSTQRVYVVQSSADHWADQYEPNPIVHVFQLNLTPIPIGQRWKNFKIADPE